MTEKVPVSSFPYPRIVRVMPFGRGRRSDTLQFLEMCEGAYFPLEYLYYTLDT